MSRGIRVGRAIVTSSKGHGEGTWKPAEPSLPLIATVHKRMQPKGEPCPCRWCEHYRKWT